MSLIVDSQGAICALGEDWPTIWEKLTSGDIPDFRGPSRLNNDEFPVPLAEVLGLNRVLEKESAEAAAARLAISAVGEALHGIKRGKKIRLYGGTTHGEYDILHACVTNKNVDSRLGLPSEWNEALVFDSIPRSIINEFGADILLDAWIYSACTSSMHAIAMAFFDYKENVYAEDIPLVLGVDALSLLEICGFLNARAIAEDACMPFHKDHSGILIGEGAAALRFRVNAGIELEGAVELIGVGMSCDAGHPMDPDPDGQGVKSAIKRSLSVAGLIPDDIAGVVLHGTGTEKNDIAENNALKQVFDNHSPPCMSVKSLMGHTMGAAGIFNCLIAIEACRQNILPPSGISKGTVLEGVDLVLDRARPIDDGPVLACSSGFGGNNCTAIFRKIL